MNSISCLITTKLHFMESQEGLSHFVCIVKLVAIKYTFSINSDKITTFGKETLLFKMKITDSFSFVRLPNWIGCFKSFEGLKVLLVWNRKSSIAFKNKEV